MLGVTGASGFIGQIFIGLIKEKNIEYRSFVRTFNSDNNSIVIGDYTEYNDWVRALSNISTLVHIASVAHGTAKSPMDYDVINCLGTLNLAKQAAEVGVKRFVFISSIGVLGNSTGEQVFTDFSIPNPSNYYTISKYKAEVGLNKISQETGLEVVIVRPTLVYGPNAPGNFGMLTKLVKTMPVLPFGMTDNRRDFIAVQNLADLLLTCANHPDAAGHTFLACDGETVSTKEFTNAVAKGLGKSMIQLPIPVGFMKFTAFILGKASVAQQLLGNLQVNSSNAKEVLGWVPPYTMEQAMASLSENKK